MTRQLMIYERAVPVSKERHRDWCVETGKDYGFARGLNSVPLLSAEFAAAATEYAVVFAGDEQAVFPAVVLGMRPNENNFVDAEGNWTGGYVPAFLRRYPFVFARSDDGQRFTLCLDEDYAGFNLVGRGERLFDSGGNRTQYLETMLNFAREYQALFDRTQQFCRKLKEHDLLQPAQANITIPERGPTRLGGFFAINREKLKALPPETLAGMARADELELCYVHLQSLHNLTPMARRLAETTPADAAAPGPDVLGTGT